jgi:hypothetical protein
LLGSRAWYYGNGDTRQKRIETEFTGKPSYTYISIKWKPINERAGIDYSRLFEILYQ